MLKTILVPTDFSDCALYATDYAVNLAKTQGAQVHLLHRVHLHPLWNVMTESEKKSYPESRFWEKVTLREFRKITEKYQNSGVTIKTHYTHGDLIPLIDEYMEELDIDLIVMGSNGANGFRELMFGSNAQKVVRKLHKPAIVVKNPPIREDIQNIVFASDFYPGIQQGFEQLCNFALEQNAKLHLVNVTTFPKYQLSMDDRSRMLIFAKMAKEKGIDIVIQEHADITIEHGIEQLAAYIGADLLAMARYPHTMPYRIVVGSLTETIVNHLALPVMTLPVEEKESITVE